MKRSIRVLMFILFVFVAGFGLGMYSYSKHATVVVKQVACANGMPVDVNGCCAGETYFKSIDACCPNDGSDCLVPLR